MKIEKSTLLWIGVGIVAAIALYFIFDSIFAASGGIFAYLFGKIKKTPKLENLEKKEDEIRRDLNELDKEIADLQRKPLTPEEEADFWNKQ